MILSILSKVIFAASIPLAIYGAYFVVVALFSFRHHKRYAQSAPKTRFALVVAARNEESVIGKLIDSLKAQNYPEDLFEIIVAPNNCTDYTEQAAIAHGARIFTPSGTVKSKGEVLTQIVDKVILAENFDAMCVFDADNLAAPNFLQEINNAMQNGAEVVQGSRDSKNPRQTAVSGWYSICYWMLNQFYNRPRAFLGLSALINGSGFAVSCDMLRQLGGWHTSTMTEDYEFSARTALLGAKVDFAPEAIVYDEQPLHFAASWKQRRRWVTGSLQGLRLYGIPLLRAVILQHSFICFDMLLTFLAPVLGLVSMVFSLFGSTLFGLIPMLIIFAASAAFTVLGSAAAAAFTMIIRRRPLNGMWGAMASFWLFLLSQMAITISCIIKKQDKWEPIVHTNAVGLDEINVA
ncbi:MAG: glycosyltransferase family 2 protein [Oscillospiraceae bacterium]